MTSTMYPQIFSFQLHLQNSENSTPKKIDRNHRFSLPPEIRQRHVHFVRASHFVAESSGAFGRHMSPCTKYNSVSQLEAPGLVEGK